MTAANFTDPDEGAGFDRKSLDWLLARCVNPNAIASPWCVRATLAGLLEQVERTLQLVAKHRDALAEIVRLGEPS